MLKKLRNLMRSAECSATILPASYDHPNRSPGYVTIPYEQQTFTDDPNWRVFRMMAESIEGFEFISKLKNEVTIFGSARTKSTNPWYKKAKELGFMLGKSGYTVITGGGPGIMEAANWGAHKAGGVSVGLDIELPHEQRRNKYATKTMGFHYFFTRKLMLTISSQAYVYFPGGFGTLDEMVEMLSLIQTQKAPREVPLILFGKKFWSPLIKWMKVAMLEENKNISSADLNIMQVVDTVEEAFEIVKKTEERAFG